MHFDILRKKRLLPCGGELAYINTSATVRLSLLTARADGPTQPSRPFLLQPSARFCGDALSPRVSFRDRQGAAAGRGRQGWHAARPQTPAHEPQVLCGGNANARPGSTGLTTICPQMMRIF